MLYEHIESLQYRAHRRDMFFGEEVEDMWRAQVRWHEGWTDAVDVDVFFGEDRTTGTNKTNKSMLCAYVKRIRVHRTR